MEGQSLGYDHVDVQSSMKTTYSRHGYKFTVYERCDF